MKMRCARTYDFECELGQVRSVPVRMGPGEPSATLFMYSRYPNIDPWEEAFTFPTDTLKMALYSDDGPLLWRHEVGPTLVPGVWFAPFIAFDLDGDGVDEIWRVNNKSPQFPLSLISMVLQRLDPRTGAVTGEWPWPRHTKGEDISHSYRFFLAGGYAHGEPVLVAAQGTYTNMYLQGHRPDLSLRWNVFIPADAPGARSSHLTPILDLDGDGVDELFWGERLLGLDDGGERACFDRDTFRGHSDIIIPFHAPGTGELLVYTCREGDRQAGKRVCTYNRQGETVWSDLDEGHLHSGWVSTTPGGGKLACAVRITRVGSRNDTSEYFYYDAVTGQRREPPFGAEYRETGLAPLDVDGDGAHEYWVDGQGKLIDGSGAFAARLGGHSVRLGKIAMDCPGEHLMLSYPKERRVRVWVDAEAKESPEFRRRYANGYLVRMQQMMGSGYNHLGSIIACGM